MLFCFISQVKGKLEPLTRPLDKLQDCADKEAYPSFANIAIEFRNLDSLFAIRIPLGVYLTYFQTSVTKIRLSRLVDIFRYF